MNFLYQHYKHQLRNQYKKSSKTNVKSYFSTNKNTSIIIQTNFIGLNFNNILK